MKTKRPDFFDVLDLKYGSKSGNIFLLHGNINDIFSRGNGLWKPLPELLTEELSRENRIFIHCDLSEGFKILPVWPSCPDDLPEEERAKIPSDEAGRERALSSLRMKHRTQQREFLRGLCSSASERARKPSDGKKPNNPFDDFEETSILEGFAGLTLAREIAEKLSKEPDQGKRLIFIVSDVSTLAPAQSEASLSEADRRNIQLLWKWFSSPAFLESRHVLIMTSISIEAVNEKIRNLPQVTPIKIWRPNAAERKNYLEYFLSAYGSELTLEKKIGIDDVVEATAGLTVRDIEQTLRTAKYNPPSQASQTPAILTLGTVRERARVVMEQSAGGHVEFLDIEQGLDAVLGQARLKPALARLAALFKANQKAALPGGILVPGPNGSGKSYIMQAFAKETGWHITRLKNIRNMWYGETERIWEVIEEIIEAIGRVLIMVDEGDTELGGRGRDVHEVDKRLFGKILRMMEDKKNKGRVCWIIITARPDKLEPDLKRSGRAGRHYPVFAPETKEERIEFVERALLSKFALSWKDFPEAEHAQLLDLTAQYYPADFSLLVEQIEELRLGGGKECLVPADIISEASALRPSDPVLQRQLQIYLALLECTDERLVPAQYTNMVKDREQLIKEILRLKQLLGETG
jgi:AAA+ superfamily predicted ATPase